MDTCEGVAKGFAKDLSKDLTCTAKESKGFFRPHACEKTYAPTRRCAALHARRGRRNPFDPFDPQVKSFANPFANPFATPSHPDGAR
ncbi:hypothetical protein SRIMM317S_02083 [Streptomyces rimosus subsp. rimosus]